MGQAWEGRQTGQRRGSGFLSQVSCFEGPWSQLENSSSLRMGDTP